MNKIKHVFLKINNFMKRFDNVYNWIVFGLLCLTIISLASYHEPFRDEVQAWNIARDLSIVDIFNQMFSEGHPCLWHLLLKPLTMLGFSVYSMTWVSVTVMLLTAWLILFKSPFSKIIRTILVFSSPFLYFYSIISRSYCLIALFITLICLVYNKRTKHPLLYGILLFFLFNTHVIMAGMASILLFFFIIETLLKGLHDKKFYKMNVLGCFIGFLGGIVLCMQIIGSYEANSLVDIVGINQYDYNSFSEYISYFDTQYKMEYYYLTNSYLSNTFISFMIGILLLAVFIGLIFKCKNTIIFVISYLFSLFVCIFLFYSIPSRTVVIIFMLMFFAWTTRENSEYSFKNKILNFFERFHILSYFIQFVLMIYCLLSIPFGVECAENDVQLLMTDAPNVAEFIRENISEDAIILSPSENLTTVILGYIPGYSFYSTENERYFTFITWDRPLNVSYTMEDFHVLFQRLQKLNKDIYLIYTPLLSSSFDSIPEKLEKQNRVEIVYESEKEYEYLNSVQEYVKFYIYRVVG